MHISYNLKKCSKTTWPGVAKLKRLRLLAQGTRRRGARESWGGKVWRRGRVRLRSWSMPRSFPPWVGCTSTCPLLRATRERRTWAVRSFFGRSASMVRGFGGYGRIWNFKYLVWYTFSGQVQALSGDFREISNFYQQLQTSVWKKSTWNSKQKPKLRENIKAANTFSRRARTITPERDREQLANLLSSEQCRSWKPEF